MLSCVPNRSLAKRLPQNLHSSKSSRTTDDFGVCEADGLAEDGARGVAGVRRLLVFIVVGFEALFTGEFIIESLFGGGDCTVGDVLCGGVRLTEGWIKNINY